MEPSGEHRSATANTRSSPTKHYSISDKSELRLKLHQWALGENLNDPAVRVRSGLEKLFWVLRSTFCQNFIPNLKDYLLARILGCQDEPEPPLFTDRDRNSVQIVGKRLDRRFTMTVYYTTYDLRRGCDKINMKGRPYVMALSRGDSSHPYVYARVLGIYRVKVLHPTMATPTTFDVLWVRWLQIDHTHRAGWKAKRLYRVQFTPSLENSAFGFLDPNDIIRGAHLIPCFIEGRAANPPAASASRWDYAPNVNWRYYYINQ